MINRMLLLVVLAILASPAVASAQTPLSPRLQVENCMKTKHCKMPPTSAELTSAKFSPALQSCLTKAKITVVTAKQLIAYDSCMIKHGVTLGTTPKTATKYKSAKRACRGAL